MKEEGNPEYQFLFNCDSPEAIYFRWRAYGSQHILKYYFSFIHTFQIFLNNKHKHTHYSKLFFSIYIFLYDDTYSIA